MVMMMVMMMVLVVVVIRLAGLLLLLRLLHARTGTADVTAMTGVAAFAALDRALSGHPHKCSRVSPARVSRDYSWSRQTIAESRYDGPNFNGSLTIALPDTDREDEITPSSSHVTTIKVVKLP